MTHPAPVLVYERIQTNRRNTVLFLALFFVLVVPVLGFVVQYLAVWFFMFLFPALMAPQFDRPGMFALPLVVAMLALLALLAVRYQHAAQAALRLLGARPTTKDEAPDLWRAVENLCIGAGLPMPELYLLEQTAPNAVAVGLQPERAALAVSRSLLALLDRRELEGVLAHELSHIGNNDIQLDTAVAVMLRTIRLPKAVEFILAISLLMQLPLLVSELRADLPDGLGWVWGALLLIQVYVLSWPLIGRLVQRAISRQREFRADADAALLTRDPEGLALALAKIDAAPRPEVRKSGAMAHLFLLEPQRPGGWRLGISTHPPVSQRIELLARMGVGIAPASLAASRRLGAGFVYSAQTTSLGAALPAPAIDPAQTTGLLESAVWGAAVGICTFVALLILNVLLLAGQAGLGEPLRALGSLGGIGASLAFGVAAHHSGLRGWRLWSALFFAFYLLAYLGPVFFALSPVAQANPQANSGLGNVLRAFLGAALLNALAALAGATVGSPKLGGWLGQGSKLLFGSHWPKL